jgi:hypothetical protein
MELLNKFFVKKTNEKSLSDFSVFAIRNAGMISIKGGTEPIYPTPPTSPVITPINKI